MNDCVGSPTAPWHPEIFSNLVPGADPMTGCLQYTACPAAYPVVFCTTVGQGLSVQRDRVIPAVTAFYEELERAADGGAPGPDAGSD